MNRATLSKALSSSDSLTDGLAHPRRYAALLSCTPCGFLFQKNHLSFFPWETCIFEKNSILEFPTRRESDRSVLDVTESLWKCPYPRPSRVQHPSTRMNFSEFPTSSESFCHLAESTLLFHDVTSDDFTWSTSVSIVRLYLLVSIRHPQSMRKDCPRKIFRSRSNPLASSKSWGSHGRLLLLGPCKFAHRRVSARSCSSGFKPVRCRFAVSKSQNISPPRLAHHWHVAGHATTPLNPITSKRSLSRARLPCNENCIVWMNR